MGFGVYWQGSQRGLGKLLLNGWLWPVPCAPAFVFYMAISFQFSAAFAPSWKLIAGGGRPPPERGPADGRHERRRI